jgi:hypothetical protein
VPRRLGVLWVFELPPVPAAELRKPVWVVPVPPAQFIRWRDILAPLIKGSRGLGQPSRPEPVDQDPCAILGPRVLVNPADLH